MKDRLLEWFANGEVGASSTAMACAVTDISSDKSYPHDPDDLNRCLLLMEAVPEIRQHMGKVAALSDTWAKLVNRWYEVELCLLDEVGLGWCNGDSAPKTYKLMQKVIR